MSEEILAQFEPDYADYLRSKLVPIYDKLTLLEIETAIAPGVTVVPMPGHTPGHCGVRLESNDESLLAMADAGHFLLQLIRPDWSPRFDRNPDQAAATRRQLFEQPRLLLWAHTQVRGQALQYRTHKVEGIAAMQTRLLKHQIPQLVRHERMDDDGVAPRRFLHDPADLFCSAYPGAHNQIHRHVTELRQGSANQPFRRCGRGIGDD